MSLPNYLANIKSAGIYRFVWDKSQMPPQQAETLRLVVGYSEKGPFNTPVYINSATEFIKIFGNISKKLEKRGIFFHRLALQALQAGPILALNLKKFLYETVTEDDKVVYEYDNVDYAVSNPIGGTDDPTTIPFEFGKTRIENVFDVTRFWTLEPDMLHKKVLTPAQLNSKNRYMVISSTDSKETSCTVIVRGYAPKGYDISIKSWYSNAGTDMPEYLEDYQDMWVSDFFAEVYVFRGKFTAAVAATEELKRYFDINGDEVTLKPYLVDAFGNNVDTLDTLAGDANSNFVQKYRGITLPYFRDLNGAYLSLDLIFNGDNDLHKLLMNFDESMLYDGDITPLDLTTRGWDRISQDGNFTLRIGTTVHNVETISSEKVTINSHTIDYPNDEHINGSEVVDSGVGALDGKKCYKITATASVSAAYLDEEDSDDTSTVVLNGSVVYVDYAAIKDDSVLTIEFTANETVKVKLAAPSKLSFDYEHQGAVSVHEPVFYNYVIPDKFIEVGEDDTITLKSAAFADLGWREGDRFLAKDGDTAVKVVNLSKLEVNYEDEKPVSVTLSFLGVGVDSELVFGDDVKYMIKCNHILGDSLGKTCVSNLYFEGYTMSPSMIKPASSKQGDKLEWQKKILSVLTDAGMFEALTNNTDVEYRLLVDTFESFVDTELKNTLSYLTRKKDNALAILNFPAISTFVNCEYTSFTDIEGFKMKYVAEGGNKKKPIGRLFTLPVEANGASWAAFYTPVAITDGTVKTNVPSAALVSNLFMEKYNMRHAYDIVAGPNYGRIIAAGLVGPDYNYSRADLDILEPFGVNCMVYVPRRGTMINSNKTAKQTPVSALSSVNVRELVIYLQDEIADLLQSYQWEFNTQALRDTVKAKADTILDNVQSNGGVYAYRNTCDETNNTDEVIDNEMFVLSTEIEPGRGAGKMVEELTIYRKGGMSSSAT